MLHAEREIDISEDSEIELENLDIVANGRNLKGRGGGRSSSGSRSSGRSSFGSGKTRSSSRVYFYGTNRHSGNDYDDDEECEEITYTDGTSEIICGDDPTAAIILAVILLVICIVGCSCFLKDKNCCGSKGNKVDKK